MSLLYNDNSMVLSLVKKLQEINLSKNQIKNVRERELGKSVANIQAYKKR